MGRASVVLVVPVGVFASRVYARVGTPKAPLFLFSSEEEEEKYDKYDKYDRGPWDGGRARPGVSRPHRQVRQRPVGRGFVKV